MVNNTDTKVAYKGNGITKTFPFSFPFFDKSYIHVAIYDSLTGTTTKLTSDYYVDEIAKTVTYPGYAPGQAPAEELQPPVLPATSTITIYRETEKSQLVDLGEKYPLPDIERMADKLTELIQEQTETLERAVKVPIGDPKSPEEKLTDLQNYVSAAAGSAIDASASASRAGQAAESAATSAANAAESERLAGGYADTASDAASRAEDSAISARAYNAPDYDNETTYQVGDVVTYTDGNSYRALQETTGNEPPNIIYWQQVTDYVGDNFFEIDEYGYIVPMDSPSHSRYWRIDQDGYIVPIEGGDGGYRPDTRSLSAEYLNVTNEGYIKHLRADDVNAQDFSATGNVTAGMVTTPQANVTTLTANAVNANSASVTEISAGTVTANDVIAKGPIVDVRAFGAKGDGVTDDTAAIQAAIDYAANIAPIDTSTFSVIQPTTVFIPSGVYKITSTVTVDTFRVSIKGDGAIIDARTISDYAMIIGHDGLGSQGQCRVAVDGIKLQGTRAVGHYGIKKIGDARVAYRNTEIQSFERGMEEFDNSYLCSFMNMEIHDCSKGYVVNSSARNNGERTSFINCVFYNNAKDFYIDTPYSEIFCTQCSFDYSADVYDNPGENATIIFNNCRFEWQHDEYYDSWENETWDGSKFKLYASKIPIRFNNCSFWYVNDEVNDKYNCLIKTTSTAAYYGVNIFDGCYWYYVGNAYTSICSNSRVRVMNSRIVQPTDKALPTFDSYSVAQAGGCSFLGVPSNIISSGGTLSINASGELLYTSTGGGGVTFYVPISNVVGYRFGFSIRASATLEFADFNVRFGSILQDGTFQSAGSQGGKNITNDLNANAGTSNNADYRECTFKPIGAYEHSSENMYVAVMFTFPGLTSGKVITFSKMYFDAY